MRALVTGGAGFIGSHVVRILINNGITVRVLDNLSTGYRSNLDGLPIEFIHGDIRDADVVAEATKGCERLFHLAACIGNVKSLQNPREDAEINVIGTINVLEAARKARTTRVIYSSSAATYGELLTIPISENHPQEPDSPYGVSKLAAEKLVLCYAKVYGIQSVCLRYFNVYGPLQRYDSYGNVIPIFANRLLSCKPLTIYGNGEQTRDFVHVRDVAMANYLAGTLPASHGVYNVASGSAITINHLARIIQELSGSNNVSVVYAPSRPGEVLHCRADIKWMQDDFDFNPNKDIESGLKEYIEWFAKDLTNT